MKNNSSSPKNNESRKYSTSNASYGIDEDLLEKTIKELIDYVEQDEKRDEYLPEEAIKELLGDIKEDEKNDDDYIELLLEYAARTSCDEYCFQSDLENSEAPYKSDLHSSSQITPDSISSNSNKVSVVGQKEFQRIAKQTPNNVRINKVNIPKTLKAAFYMEGIDKEEAIKIINNELTEEYANAHSKLGKPWFFAALDRHYFDREVIDIFLKNNVNINIQDKNGNTLLHHVLKNKKNPEIQCLQLLEIFVHNGGDLSIKNNEGYTIRQLAEKREFDDVAKCIDDSLSYSQSSELTKRKDRGEEDERAEYAQKKQKVKGDDEEAHTFSKEEIEKLLDWLDSDSETEADDTECNTQVYYSFTANNSNPQVFNQFSLKSYSTCYGLKITEFPEVFKVLENSIPGKQAESEVLENNYLDSEFLDNLFNTHDVKKLFFSIGKFHYNQIAKLTTALNSSITVIYKFFTPDKRVEFYEETFPHEANSASIVLKYDESGFHPLLPVMDEVNMIVDNLHYNQLETIDDSVIESNFYDLSSLYSNVFFIGLVIMSA